jgi:hypothetical protein
MSVFEDFRIFFLSDPARIGAQPVSAAEIVETVHATSAPALAPSPLARIAADLLATRSLASPPSSGDAKGPQASRSAP